MIISSSLFHVSFAANSPLIPPTMQALQQAVPTAASSLSFLSFLRCSKPSKELAAACPSQSLFPAIQSLRQTFSFHPKEVCSKKQSLKHEGKMFVAFNGGTGFSPPASATVGDPIEQNKRAQVSRRLADTARHFKRLGSFGFWGQLVCSLVSATILAFAILISGNATAPVTGYLTAAGIATGFLAVFWSFRYIRIAGRLQAAANDPSKAPPRSEVSSNLKQGLVINLLGMGATLLGMQATVGLLVGKALTSPATPFLQGPTRGYSPVLALDVFLVQACANTFLSHFIGLVSSLELLRTISSSQSPPPESVIPKVS